MESKYTFWKMLYFRSAKYTLTVEFNNIVFYAQCSWNLNPN